MILKLLTAIAIIAVLAVLSLGGFKSIQEQARSTHCVNNLRQLGLASQVYATEHQGVLPFYYTTYVQDGQEKGSYTMDGAWFWHLAPYFNIPRWESVGIRLGPEGGFINKPNVFTCPSHGKDEPEPIEYPSYRPVSYSPTVSVVSTMKPVSAIGTTVIKGLRIADVPWPTKKVWLLDSTKYSVLNVSEQNWIDEGTGRANAKQAFNRHKGAGNALFFDGHVESIPYHSIVNENFSQNLRNYFSPLVEVR